MPLSLGTLWLNHLVGCLWYFCGRLRLDVIDTGTTWLASVTAVGDKDVVFQEQGLAYQYLTARHCFVATITMGAVDVTSVNSVECVYIIGALMLGLILSSTLVSMLSAAMLGLQEDK